MTICNHASSDIDLMASSISSDSAGGGSGKPVCILHVNVSLSEEEQYCRNDNLTLKFDLINKDSHDINRIELEAELGTDFLNLTDQSDKRSIYIQCPKLPAKSHKIIPFTIRISPKAILRSPRMIIVPGSIKIDFKEKYSAPEIEGTQKPILITNRIPTIISSMVNILSPCVPSDKELFVLENKKIIRVSFSARANDDDGDVITYRWIIPETGKIIDEMNDNSDNLTLNFTDSIIGKKMSFIVSANDGYNYSENSTSILSYKDSQYDDIIVPGDDYYRNVAAILILVISAVLLGIKTTKKCQKKFPKSELVIKYMLFIYLVFIFNILIDLSVFFSLLLSVMLTILVAISSRYLEKTKDINYRIYIRKNVLLRLMEILIIPLLLIMTYLYFYEWGFLKNPDGSPLKFLGLGFPILFNSTYFLEIVIFLLVFYFISCVNDCLGNECKDIPDKLWTINLVSMAPLLFTLCIIIPQIDASKMPDHLHYYYSSMTQVFATIIAIIAATINSGSRQPIYKDEIKIFAALNISIVLFSFLGLTAFVYNINLSPILESLDFQNWMPIFVFETTLLMIPAALYSLYEVILTRTKYN